MRAFAREPKAARQTSSGGSAAPGRRHFGHEVDSILHLQRTIGNRAVQRLMGQVPTHLPAPGPIQARLAVNQPGDEFEREADRVAERVMRMPDPQTQGVDGGAFHEGEADQPGGERKSLQTRQAGGVNLTVQRDCSDPDFCTPYTSAAEIADAKSYLLTYFLPVLEGYFGSDVGRLWRQYLSRKPGDSLSPVVFNREGNSIYDSFSTNNYIYDETDRVLELVAGRLSRGYGNVTQPITNFLSSSEMELNTDFANPFTIPGNIAGGVGSSDAGPDSRRITWGHVSFDVTRLPLGKKLVNIEVVLGFEVKDAVDLCPGACGAVLEQALATIRMSRLEASGEAYDVPFVVRFTGPHRNKRVID